MRGDYSPLDIQRCGLVDWSIFGVFIFTMLLMSYFGLQINKKEQALKIKAHKGMVDSDIRYSGY